jgi:hypothetical protein
LLDHPGTVDLREVDLLPHLDGWRTGLFDPATRDATLDARRSRSSPTATPLM